MSTIYDGYIQNHKYNVVMAFNWIKEKMPDIFKAEFAGTYDWNICYAHDDSKISLEEYKAYDEYFYGDKSHAVVKAFDQAWLHHIHNNPHHWQHWILFEDDPKTGKPYRALDMPDPYIVEMICDWWSFSFKSGDLKEIFSWYGEHKNKMILSDKTRKRVEYILERIKKELEDEESE